MAVRWIRHGRRPAAAMHSVIVTAKLNDADPCAWLADVLARIGDHLASRLEQRRRWDRGCPLHHPGWSHLNTSEGSRLRCRQCFPPIIELTGASAVLMRNFVTDVPTSVADLQFPSLTRHEFRLCAAIVRLWSTVHPRCRSPRLINSIQDCERSCKRSYARALGRDSPYRVCLRLYDVNEQPLHASAQFEVGATRPHTLRPRPHQSLDRTAPEGVTCNC